MSEDERNKYDIWTFHFTCFHECHEWKWGKCAHCRSKNTCQDHIRHVYLSEEGIYFPTEKIEVFPRHIQDLGFYIHEFTEVSIIQIFRRLHIDWHKDMDFLEPEKSHTPNATHWKIKKTYIVHIISPYGTNNGSCLEPATRKNRPKW